MTSFELITFDCYGTLIDGENGIIKKMIPVLESHGVSISKNSILEAYSKYRVVLREVLKKFGHEFNFIPTKEDELILENSLISFCDEYISINIH